MLFIPMSRDSRPLSRLFSSSFDDTFERLLNPAAAAEGLASRSPVLDVAENERAYTVKLEVPGVAREDVKVAVEGRQISVQAHSPQVDEKQVGDRLVYRERAVTSYARSFTLPVEVDQAEAVAKLEQGVLTLTLPKRGVRGAAHLTVN